MMMTFNVVDVETANCDRSSICSIGIINVRDGKIANKWQTLVNPETWFDPFNISRHGIKEEAVKHSFILPMVHDELCSQVNDSILVSHSAFDRTAFSRATDRYDLEQLRVTWLDSTKIVRRAWEKYAHRGYGLKNVARDLGITFKHHNALEDAIAAAEIVLRACKDTGIDIEGWLRRVEYPISSSQSSSSKVIKREGNVDGALYGETVVFTGTIKIPRRQAAALAAAAGCNVVDNTSKKVTMLVVGTQDMDRLNGYEKSKKHRKVEELIKKGFEIKILSEDDFFNLMDFDSLK